jgi:hypothetical protein
MTRKLNTPRPAVSRFSEHFRRADVRFSRALNSVAYHTSPQQIVAAVRKGSSLLRDAMAHGEDDGEGTVQEILAALAVESEVDAEADSSEEGCPPYPYPMPPRADAELEDGEGTPGGVEEGDGRIRTISSTSPEPTADEDER